MIFNDDTSDDDPNNISVNLGPENTIDENSSTIKPTISVSVTPDEIPLDLSISSTETPNSDVTKERKSDVNDGSEVSKQVENIDTTDNVPPEKVITSETPSTIELGSTEIYQTKKSPDQVITTEFPYTTELEYTEIPQTEKYNSSRYVDKNKTEDIKQYFWNMFLNQNFTSDVKKNNKFNVTDAAPKDDKNCCNESGCVENENAPCSKRNSKSPCSGSDCSKYNIQSNNYNGSFTFNFNVNECNDKIKGCKC